LRTRFRLCRDDDEMAASCAWDVEMVEEHAPWPQLGCSEVVIQTNVLSGARQ
jgi:hypothetical protein